MLVNFMILACAFVACVASPPQPEAKPLPAAKPQEATPQAAPLPSPPIQAPESRVYCGETPSTVFGCIGNPKVVNKTTAEKCNKRLSECDRIKCIFRESGWSTASSTQDDTVNKQKVAEYFNQYAVEKPLWSTAVQHLKAACLDKVLPAQGAFLNCAAYDVLHCVITSFLRNAAPSQWRNTAECAYPRAFAAACPVCPTSCFAAQVPQGTCHACQALPRTP